MNLGLVGRKCGMSRVFDANGASLPVTVVEVLEQKVAQVKDLEKDGYRAVQVAYGNKHNRKVTKPLQGHYKKAGVDAALGLMEFRLDDVSSMNVGDEIKLDIIQQGQFVDVLGVSRGKGFAGTIKRHNFTMGDATHGNSLSHRAPGSIGQRQTPGRVFKGKRMAGRMGGKNVTVQNLEVVRVVPEKNLLLIKGAVPGAPGGLVVVKPAEKRKKIV
ncbi:MAG: rplC [Gammaproteobacteria bacterium]|jgi:large subunit ribosomal protein L3|nr:rplC [Gammaproteobacteria bacterium]